MYDARAVLQVNGDITNFMRFTERPLRAGDQVVLMLRMTRIKPDLVPVVEGLGDEWKAVFELQSVLLIDLAV